MDRLSMLAFHPVKMQSCYEKVEQLKLEGLQERFNVSSTSVFVSRAQILMWEVRRKHSRLHGWTHSLNFMTQQQHDMRSLLPPAGQKEHGSFWLLSQAALLCLLCHQQQMDNAVYTFEHLLNQSLEAKGEDDMCKTIQRCQDRVLKVREGKCVLVSAHVSDTVKHPLGSVQHLYN